MFRRGTNRLVIPLDLDTERKPEYPRAAFDAIKGKPRLTLPTTKSGDLPQYRGIIHHHLTKAEPVKVEMVLAFLAEVALIWTQTLKSKWESFGNVIGQVQEKISVLSLFEVTRGKPVDPEKQTEINEDDQDVWMVLVLLGLPRIHQTSAYSGYEDTLKGKLLELAKASGAPPGFSIHPTQWSGWVQDPNFKKMSAGYDMFFSKFPKAIQAKVRFGTICSRFKDCAILSSLSHLRETTGLTMTQIKDWILVSSIAAEYEQVMKPGNELDLPDSYTPYLSDMGLGVKSPYSVKSCATLHLWAHLTCLYLGSLRSRNAPLPHEANLIKVQVNAALFAFALRRGAPQFQGKDETKIDDVGMSGSMSGLNPYPSGIDASSWLIWYNAAGGHLDKKIIAVCNDASSKISDVRPKTVGEWLSSHPLIHLR